MLIAVVLNISMGRFTEVSPWFTSIAALAFSIFSPLIFILEFLLGYELIDPIFKKKQSVNIIGTLHRPGTQSVKRFLLSGHHDSALENTWHRLIGYGFYPLAVTFFIGFVTILAMNVIQLTGMITGNAGVVHLGTLGWVFLVYPMIPSVLIGLFSMRGSKDGGVVLGAADYLSACAIAVAICRFLVKNPSYNPADTEIKFVSFGSEEAGLRVSKRYVQGHLDELKRMDATLLNFVTVAHPEIDILTSDVNGFVKNSPELVKSVVAAAQRARVPYRLKSAFLGVGSDAGPFSQAGFKATSLLPFKVPQQMVAFYHQRWDGPEILTIEPMLNVMKLSLEWIRNGGE